MDYNYFEAVCDDVREVIVGRWADSFADVLIRCYYLGAAIDEVLPDFEKYFNAAHEEARG